MNKLFLIICLISMIFLCKFSAAFTQENPLSPRRIRTISGSFEDGLLEACAKIAQTGGCYPAYVSNIPDIEEHLNMLKKTCGNDTQLTETILTSIPKTFKEEAHASFPAKLLEHVKILSTKTHAELSKEFLDIPKS